MAKFLERIDYINSKVAGLLIDDDINLSQLSAEEDSIIDSTGKPHLVSSVYPNKKTQDDLMRYFRLRYSLHND